MGLLMSDTVLIDPLLDEILRLPDGLGEWAYTLEMSRDAYEYQATASTEWPRPFTGSPRWPVAGPTAGWSARSPGRS